MKFIGGNNIAIDADRGLFRVARRAFVSDAILEVERDEIFDKCWLYLGHDSEVAEAGSFISRGVGGRDLIFNRDQNGTVHAFLDACPHRGAKLCLERSGVAHSFNCIYHGWSFAADGKFRRHAHHKTYPAGFEDGGAVDLVSVPKLESYRGFWFVCFDRDAVPLAEPSRGHGDLAAQRGGDRLSVDDASRHVTAANRAAKTRSAGCNR